MKEDSGVLSPVTDVIARTVWFVPVKLFIAGRSRAAPTAGTNSRRSELSDCLLPVRVSRNPRLVIC